MQKGKSSKLLSLQALRAVAAISVAAMHCFLGSGGRDANATPLFHNATRFLCSFAGSGVDIFFVLSGFLICQIAQRSNERGISASIRFAVRRAGRIYPLFWVTLGGFMLFILTRGYTLPDNSPVDWFRIATLTTITIPYQDPAWTLAYEIWFYFGMSIILLMPARWLDRALLGWLAIQGICFFMAPTKEVKFSATYMFEQIQLFEFFFGCFVARLISCGFILKQRNAALLCLLVGAGIFLIGCYLNYVRFPLGGTLNNVERTFYSGVPSLLFVYGLLSLESLGHLKVPGWLEFMGDASYSVYLWHYPMMGIFFVMPELLPQQLQPIHRAVLNLVLTLVIAPISYRLVERPFIRLVHWLTPSPRSASQAEVHGLPQKESQLK